MASSPDINFVGNIEGKDVISGVTDVIVCDGFVGNVMLKTVEGVGFSIFSILKNRSIKIGWPKSAQSFLIRCIAISRKSLIIPNMVGHY